MASIADDSCSVQDVQAFYPQNTIITSVKGSKDKHTAVLRLKCSSKEEFKEWLKEYQTLTGDTMRVSRGVTTVGKTVVYKAWYRCQHNTETNHHSKQHSSKNTGCETNCLVRIKSSVKWRRVRSQDVLRSQYPTEVIFHRKHNHSIHSAEAIKYKDVDEDVRMKFIELFKSHHSPSRALEIHRQDLLEEFEDDYYKISADKSRCPDLHWVFRLYYGIFEKEFGGKGNDVYENIKEIIDSNPNNLEVKIDKIEDNVVVAIITPFMERVHSIDLSEHIVFVDSSGIMDRHNCRVFLIMCDSNVGGLTLGVILSTSEAEKVITRGFQLFKEIMPTNAFHGRGPAGPEIFLTDDSVALRKALAASFPTAKLWLCSFHVLQAVWRWLNSQKNSIKIEHKQILFMLFKRMLLSNTSESFESAVSEFKGNEVLKLYPNFEKYIDSLLNKSEAWCYKFREHSRNNNTNNIVESAMNVLKDKILNRCRAFNIKQLFHYLSTTLPDYYSRKILDIITGRHSSYLHLRYLPKKSKIEGLKITFENCGIYEVTNTKLNTRYDVNFESGTCTCPVGSTGGPCKHQHFIALNRKSDNINIVPITLEKKKIYHWVATGSNDVPSNWYDPLHLNQPASETISTNANSGIQTAAISISGVSVTDSNEEGDKPTEQDIDCAKEKLKEIFEIMTEKLERDPSNFITAVHAMHRTSIQVKNSDSALCSAMHTFGKMTSKKYASNIPVQPTSVSRRRSKLSTRKCQPKGRPAKESFTPEHAYSKSRSKHKAPHSLSECILRNASLGKN